MVFCKTSSFDHSKLIVNNVVNNTFNLLDLSTILAEDETEQWRMIQTFQTQYVVDRFYNYRVPLTFVEFSKPNNYLCDFEECKEYHKISIDVRNCCEYSGCPVKYKTKHCTSKKIFNIYQKCNHTHELLQSYNNIRGIDPFFVSELVNLSKNKFVHPNEFLRT